MTFLAAIAEAEGGRISLRTQEAMARLNVRAAIARHFAEGEFNPGEIATMFNASRASVYRESVIAHFSVLRPTHGGKVLAND